MEENRAHLYIVLAVVMMIGYGIMGHLKEETAKIVKTSNVILPAIAGQSFYIGCMASESMASDDCMQLMEQYKKDTAEINRLED